MYKNILVPIDLRQSDKGKKALKLAQKMCFETGHIHLLYIGEDIPLYLTTEIPLEFLEHSKENAVEAISELVKETKDARISYHIDTGSPAAQIVHYADKQKIDFIIIASHCPDLSDYFLGSTAAKVVRHAKCPVLVNR